MTAATSGLRLPGFGSRRASAPSASATPTAQARRGPFLALIAGLIVGAVWLLLALNTAAAADEVQARSLIAANSDTQNKIEQLQVLLSDDEAPAALAAAASRLGMVPDVNPLFLSVHQDGAVSVLGVPIPVTRPVNPFPLPTPTPAPVKIIKVSRLPGGAR